MERLRIEKKKFQDQSQRQLNVMNEKDLKSKSSSLEVIPLTLKDLNACLKLDKIALKGLWSKSLWEKELSDSRRICLGIFDHSNLIAIGCGWIVVDELQLTAIAVHPIHRRRGLAKLILSNLLVQATHKGCKRATLEVKSNNSAALAFYKSFGFIISGSRRNYYKNGANALIQWKPLKL